MPRSCSGLLLLEPSASAWRCSWCGLETYACHVSNFFQGSCGSPYLNHGLRFRGIWFSVAVRISMVCFAISIWCQHSFDGGSLPCPKMIALTTFRAKPTQPMIMTRKGFSTAVANVSLPRGRVDARGKGNTYVAPRRSARLIEGIC